MRIFFFPPTAQICFYLRSLRISKETYAATQQRATRVHRTRDFETIHIIYYYVNHLFIYGCRFLFHFYYDIYQVKNVKYVYIPYDAGLNHFFSIMKGGRREYKKSSPDCPFELTTIVLRNNFNCARMASIMALVNYFYDIYIYENHTELIGQVPIRKIYFQFNINIYIYVSQNYQFELNFIQKSHLKVLYRIFCILNLYV